MALGPLAPNVCRIVAVLGGFAPVVLRTVGVQVETVCIFCSNVWLYLAVLRCGLPCCVALCCFLWCLLLAVSLCFVVFCFVLF